MGRYSSDSDSYHSYSRSNRKKKKRRSRSRSSSVSSVDSRRSHRSKKSKKSSRRRRSRSYSPSSDKYRRRRRSRSKDRRRSRSRSRSYSRRSYSRSRSRSPARRRRGRSRSRSRNRRSRSRSPGRRRSRSPRRRSRSRSRSSTRSSRKGKSDSRDCSVVKSDPSLSSLPHAKQSELQLQLALKAAAAADEKLKEAGLLPVGVGRSVEDLELTFKEQQDRIEALEAIEDDGFQIAAFSSNRQQKVTNSDKQANPTHDNAIFGTLPLEIKQESAATTKLTGSILHPCFYVPMEEKMDRWRQKLIEMRNKKLEGEAM